MSNFFDQFDESQQRNKSNFFDKFDDATKASPEEKGTLSQVGSAFGAGIDKMQELGYRAVKGFTDVGVPQEEQTNALGRAIGQGGSLSRWLDEGIARNIEEQKAYTPSVASYKDIDSIGDAASYVGEMTAQSVPMMATALSPAGLLTMGGGLSNEAYEAQPEDNKQPWRATASGFAQAGLERLGVETAIGRVFGGEGKQFVKRVGQSMLGEGATETGQQALAQWGSGKSLDEFEGLDEAFVGGALVGGTIRTGTEAGKAAYDKYRGERPELSDIEETDLTQSAASTESVIPDPFADIETAQGQAATGNEVEIIPGETAGDAQPNWQYGKNDDTAYPYRGQVTPYTFTGEYEQYRETPSSVPVGAALEAPVIDGEFERPRGLPNRADTIISEDGRPMQQAQEFADSVSQTSNRALPFDDVIYAEDKRNVQVKRNGQPFGGRRAAELTKEFRQAKEQGLNPQVIKVNGGYGWVSEGDNVGLDTGSVEQSSDLQVGSAGVALPRDVRGGEGRRLRESADGTNGTGDAENIALAARRDTNDDALNAEAEEIPTSEGAAELGAGSQLTAIDAAANEAATSPTNDRPEPTEAQKEAGNYKKGKVRLHGLDISIENPKGSTRKGKDQDGKEWSSEMKHHYGDIKGTTGADGDSIDVFIGDNPESQKVFVVDQVDPKTGNFDEVKVMMGFDDAETAKSGYLSNYDKDWKGLGEITEASVEDFKAWTKRPRKSKQPFALPAKPKSEEVTVKGQEDWGEKITTARKNISVRWNENSTDEEISSKPLSKTWPEKEFDDVGDTYASAFAFAARGEIPRKPSQPYKKQRWVEKVKNYRQLVKDNVVDGLLTGKITKEKMKELGGKRNLQDFFAKVDLLSELDRKDWGKVERVMSYPDSMDFNPKTEKLDIPNPKTYVRINGRNREFNSTDPKVLAEQIKPYLDEKVDKPQMKFEVRGRNGSYFINKKGDPEYTRLATFDSSKEAFDFIRNSNSKLVESWESHKARVNVTKADIRNKVNKPRTGEDYRNGKNATAEDFQNTFGIKRGTFGKWVKQGKERQDMLNGTYDALMDLANITGVPPRALSLEGKLGFAFGANGRGKAMAHYEPGEVVINLTKTKGAGSLAHEWFHALDNYFQKKRDTLPTTEKGNFITHNPETYYIGPRGYSVPESRFRDMRGINKNEWRRVEGVRPEVATSFKNLVDTLNGMDFAKRSSRLDKGKAGGYWSSNLEMAARAFESYVKAKMSANGYDNDFLANVTSATDFVRDDNRYPYIKADEIAEVEAAFDDLFNTIESKESDNGDVTLFSVAGTVTGNTNTRTVSRSNANEIVSRFVKGLTSAGKNYVSVVSSYDDLPTEIKDAAKAQGVEYQVKGVFHKGKVHVVLDQHTSALDMETTLFHEAYGHLGIKNLFGDNITKKLNSLFIANGGLKGLRETANRHGINLEKYIKGLDKTNMPQEMKNRVLMDELLAHLQQSNKPSVKRLAREIVGLIRDKLRKLGLPGLSKVTDSDLFYILKKARDAAKKGDTQNGDARFMFDDKGASVDSEISSEPTSFRVGEEGNQSENKLMESAKQKLGLKENEAKSIVSKVKEAWKDVNYTEAKNRVKEGLFDSLYGIKKAEDAQNVSLEKSGYVSARLAQGVGDVIHATMFYGSPEWRDGIVQKKEGTNGLLDIFSQLDSSELNDWLAWMGGNRANVLMKQGRENNLNKSEIEELQSLNIGREELFNKVKEEYNAANSAVLKLAIDSGLLDSDVMNKFESEWYVPFFRAEDPTDINEVIKGPTSPNGIANASAQIKTLKGGEQSTKDILQNILQRQATLIDASMKNKAMLEVAGNLDGTPFMKKVKLNKIQIDAITKKRLAKKATPYVSVNENGETQWYEVLEPSLLRALMQLNVKRSDNPLMKLSRAAKRYLTTGVTLSPTFIIRNYLRDGVHGWMINKDKFVFGLDSVKGAVKTWKKDQSTIDLMFAGASFQGGYVHANDPEQGAQQIRRALRKKGLSESAISKYMASIPKGAGQFFEKYRDFSDSMENANRVSTYDASLKANKSKKQSAFEARDFMDFGLQGNFSAMQFLTDVIPFLNARMQGLYKLYRAGKAGEGESFAKVLSKELAIKGMYVASFSLALALYNMDDERYEELPDWDKDANWHFFNGETHIRIPKPFELGVIFGTVPERLFMRTMGKQNNKDLERSMTHAVTSTLAMNPIPQIIKPGFEVWANYDFFSGRPIDSFSDQFKRPQDRYSMYTTETAKIIGDAFGASPQKIEHLVRGYAGTLGSYVLSSADIIGNSFATATGKGEFKINEFDDLSLIRAFVKTGEVGGTYYGEQFYDTLQEINSLYKQYVNANQEQDEEAAEEILKEGASKLEYRSMFNKTQAYLNKLNHQRNVVWKDTSIPLKEREKIVDDINREKNAVYRYVVLEYRKMND